MRGIKKNPVLYCSKEAHHSVIKAAKASGLGYDAVRSIPTDDNLIMDLVRLKQRIKEDQAAGRAPFMIIGTAGTTGAGAIDGLKAIQKITEEFDLWFHVDAAYGGAAVLNPELRLQLDGVEAADSITFDAHKWISMPMGIGMLLTSHPQILRQTFDVDTDYLPKEKEADLMPHPYAYSIQWSRRFMGLKLYLSLLIFGWEGFSEMVGHQSKVGAYLKKKLLENNWKILNSTPLPIVCFTDAPFQSDKNFPEKIVKHIVNSGKSWLSNYPIKGIPAIRACISNYATSTKEVDELIAELNEAREAYKQNKTKLATSHDLMDL